MLVHCLVFSCTYCDKLVLVVKLFPGLCITNNAMDFSKAHTFSFRLKQLLMYLHYTLASCTGVRMSECVFLLPVDKQVPVV